MDTPWHVSQPHGKPFDLSLSNEQIYTLTEDLIRDNPSFSSQEDWRREMQLRISANH